MPGAHTVVRSLIPRRQIAFVTYDRNPGVSVTDSAVIAPLSQQGVDVVGVSWSDPTADWARYDLIVVRSCWDYYQREEDFIAWLEQMRSSGLPVWNSPETLRWNMNKSYLRDLEAAGVAIPESIWIDPGDEISIGAVLRERSWDRVVMKPVVSASADRTYLIEPGDPKIEDTLAQIVSTTPAVCQRYLPEIEEEGEWSCLFFGGEFSHAVRKRPRGGDFRVQVEHGGTAEAATPPPELVAAARNALNKSHRDTLYARVDGVVSGGEFVLLELELLEPELFLDRDPEAADRFASAILARLAPA